MIETIQGSVTLLRFECLYRVAGLVHAFTTRPQNYAPHRGPGAEAAVGHRRRACEALGVSYDRLTSPSQVHGGEVVAIEASDIGCGRDGRGSALPYVDGLVTDRVGVPLVLMTADCPLVCAYDPVRRAIGAVHSSWQGTVAHATTQMIRVMQQQFGCNPSDLLCAIAPSAGPCCYEVGRDVQRIARTKLPDADTFLPRRDGRMTFDLWSANARQLVDAGCDARKLEIAGLCSICDQRFWSHRRDKDLAGRSALFLAMVE